MGLRKCNLEDEFINCSLIDEYAFTSMFALYGVIHDELNASLSMDESSLMATFMLYTAIYETGEPTSYREAIESPDSIYWKEAIKKEISSIEKTGTWEYCQFPEKHVSGFLKRKQIPKVM